MNFLTEYKNIIEEHLALYIHESNNLQKNIYEAVKYSLLDAGKRIRPIITLEFCRACGGNIEDAMPFACALEMIHCYSLIHDDLPCMDDDDLRRGKPSSHIKFGEALAVLAGDALQALAFETALNPAHTNNLEPERAMRAAFELAKAAGTEGMVGGQVIDMESEGKEITIETLEAMDAGKTGALIVAAAKMGCIAAGSSDETLFAAETFARHLGISFQIIDDILDKTSDTQTLGKPAGSDAASVKSTYVSILGMEKARIHAQEHTQKAKNALDIWGDSSKNLLELTDYLSSRKK